MAPETAEAPPSYGYGGSDGSTRASPGSDAAAAPAMATEAEGSVRAAPDAPDANSRCPLRLSSSHTFRLMYEGPELECAHVGGSSGSTRASPGSDAATATAMATEANSRFPVRFSSFHN
jgi:nitrous oxide reductase accessory protein NosL